MKSAIEVMFWVFGQPHDAHQQRREQPDHQHRTDIDGEEFVAGARGRADRTEERPRRAIDRQRQRIDQQPGAALAAKPAGPVPVARHQEQQADIGKRHRDDDPALQHVHVQIGPKPRLGRILAPLATTGWASGPLPDNAFGSRKRQARGIMLGPIPTQSNDRHSALSVPSSISRTAMFRHLAETLAIAAAGGLTLGLLGMPAGFLSGSILAVAGASLAGRPMLIPTPLLRVLLVLIGISLGSVVTPETLHGMATYPLSIAALIVAMAVISFGGAAYLRAVHGWDTVTAYLAAAPGGLSQVMAACRRTRRRHARHRHRADRARGDHRRRLAGRAVAARPGRPRHPQHRRPVRSGAAR